MNWHTVEVKAKFAMLSTAESGWTSPITSGLRPNHNFYGPENRNLCFGQVTVPNDDWIYPGEEKEVYIKFGLLSQYKNDVVVGFRWRIQAGVHHFADGEVIELIKS